MTERIIGLAYHSCNIVLEVNVYWDKRGMKREAVLAKLPEHLLNDYDAAVPYVLPFVAAVQHKNRKALAEVERAILAQRVVRDSTENRVIDMTLHRFPRNYYDLSLDGPECYYDPRGFDRDEWLPKLLCRVGRCGNPVLPGSTFCRSVCGLT